MKYSLAKDCINCRKTQIYLQKFNIYNFVISGFEHIYAFFYIFK